MLSVRSEVDHVFNKAAALRVGVDAAVDNYTADKQAYADPEDPDTIRFNDTFPPRTDTAFGAWAEMKLNVTPAIEVTPGVRFDGYASQGATAYAVDPRISARIKVTDKFRIVHAYGLAHQPPSFIIPIPGLTPGKLSGGLQSSWQTSAGIEADLPADTTATANVFHNAFFNMTDALGTHTGPDGALERSNGQAYGFELFIKRKLTARLGGYLSYTLSRSTRTVDGATFPSAFDRTHVASAAVAYDLGRNWRFGTRFVFYTGVPKQQPTNGITNTTPAESPERDPAFYRIDVWLEKRWQLSQTSWVSLVFEMLNATLHKETFGNTEIGPVSIPSIGLEAGF
jgi:hypothetical protein